MMDIMISALIALLTIMVVGIASPLPAPQFFMLGACLTMIVALTSLRERIR